MSNFALTFNTANINRMTARRAVPSIFGWAAAAAKKYSSGGCFGNDQKTKKFPRRMYNFGLKTQMCLHQTTKRLLGTVRRIRVASMYRMTDRVKFKKTGGIRIYRLDTIRMLCRQLMYFLQCYHTVKHAVRGDDTATNNLDNSGVCGLGATYVVAC